MNKTHLILFRDLRKWIKEVEVVNHCFKSLILDVSLSSKWVCVYDNYLSFVLTLYSVSGMEQPGYWCSPATSAEESYNRWVSSVKKVIFFPNFVVLWRTDMPDFNRGGGISNLLGNARKGDASDRYWKEGLERFPTHFMLFPGGGKFTSHP